ncbi:hypothetical protein HAX54_000470, partial [Datura stramonium]|nr:hypothetical protein [Datura stramonium]
MIELMGHLRNAGANSRNVGSSLLQPVELGTNGSHRRLKWRNALTTGGRRFTA